ncbi:hypothetical protein Nepgr_019168 [Nepenthes gracilis]|uniref:O-methyltransferase C-terminal domain-containing protein n=1 Tax=Nepenthes gracilis TaxID=150966 RepID=A0AAD3SVC2_NEPGR|nr:hypothetical protein Nepgr_019168 [Nepenthes gracilis]
MAASAEEIESNVDALFSCENSADDIEIYLSAGQMVHSVAFSMVLHTAIELGLGKLKEAILEGGTPFNRAHGSHAFEYFGMDPRFNKVFNAAMYNVSTIYMNKIVLSYGCGFENIRQLVDVGGGVGDALKTIVSKYPHIKGINYDLPHVIQHAIPCSGVEHIGGDMFESVPSGDAIWMKVSQTL